LTKITFSLLEFQKKNNSLFNTFSTKFLHPNEKHRTIKVEIRHRLAVALIDQLSYKKDEPPQSCQLGAAQRLVSTMISKIVAEKGLLQFTISHASPVGGGALKGQRG